MCVCVWGGAFKDTSKAEGPLVAFCRKLERVKKLREGCQNFQDVSYVYISYVSKKLVGRGYIN